MERLWTLLSTYASTSRASTSNAPTSNDSSKLTRRPSDLKQLNESVWEFWQPPPDSEGVPKIEILFFHGAQRFNDSEAFWKTWLSRDECVLWPTTWLAKSFPEARMLFISYDSSVGNHAKDAYAVMENLMQDIIWSSTCNAGQRCPVILVGHSSGGIIMKDFLIKCSEYTAIKHPMDKTKRFLLQCKALHFYGTPHAPLRLLDGSAYRNFVVSDFDRPPMDFLKILNEQCGRINEKFSYLRNVTGWQSRGVGETLHTRLRVSSFHTTA